VTQTISKLIWLAFGIGWFVLRMQPRRRAKQTPVRYSGRGLREYVLLVASLTGLGIIPVVYIAAHFPRSADYPFVPVLSYLGIAVDVACLWLFHRTHRDLGLLVSPALRVLEEHFLCGHVPMVVPFLPRRRHPRLPCGE